MSVRNYRDLVAWQKAMDLVVTVYSASRSFPETEKYGLASQVRKAAVSIPSNVAEGEERGGAPDFVRFLRIAYGSLREVETQLMIAQRLQYIDTVQLNELLVQADEVGRLINGLIRHKTKSVTGDT